MDFLIPPSLDTDKGGDLRHIEKDFAAVITPGLHLAFQDKKKVPLKGVTLKGEKVFLGQISRDIGVKFSSKTFVTHKIDPMVD